MERFIPKQKLSKKAKQELNRKRRQTWSISPISRKSGNKKAYDRKTPRRYEDEYPNGGVFYTLVGSEQSKRVGRERIRILYPPFRLYLFSIVQATPSIK